MVLEKKKEIERKKNKEPFTTTIYKLKDTTIHVILQKKRQKLIFTSVLKKITYVEGFDVDFWEADIKTKDLTSIFQKSTLNKRFNAGS